MSPVSPPIGKLMDSWPYFVSLQKIPVTFVWVATLGLGTTAIGKDKLFSKWQLAMVYLEPRGKLASPVVKSGWVPQITDQVQKVKFSWSSGKALQVYQQVTSTQ